MEAILANPVFWIAVAAASEIIGLNPKMKDNTVLQTVYRVANYLKPFRKEDDTIQKAKNILK